MLGSALTVFLLASIPAQAATRDRTRPAIRYRTANHSVLLSNPAGLRSEQIPIEAVGTATDSGVGIRSVSVVWFRCTYGTSSGCLVVAQIPEPTPSVVDLSCSTTRRSCTWRATAPSVPGQYVFAATARDRNGNASHRSGLLDLTVV